MHHLYELTGTREALSFVMQLERQSVCTHNLYVTSSLRSLVATEFNTPNLRALYFIYLSVEEILSRNNTIVDFVDKENWILYLNFLGRICFLCDSRNEPCSEDSVNGTRTATCSEGNEFCEVVKDGRHGETRFYRDCVNKCDKEFVNWEKDGEEYCKMCCDNDLCNVGRCGSPVALTLSGTLIVLNAIVAFRCMFVFA